MLDSEFSICFKLSPDLRKSLTSLVYSIFLQDVAVVTGSSVCSIEFYKALRKDLKDHRMYHQLKPKLYHIIHNNTTIRDQNHELFYLKSQQISLIILLLLDNQASEFFKDAEHFALLGASHFWLIPYHTEDVKRQSEPTRTLTLQVV